MGMSAARCQGISVSGEWSPCGGKGRGWREGKEREGRGHSLIFTWIDASGRTDSLAEDDTDASVLPMLPTIRSSITCRNNCNTELAVFLCI